MEKRVKGGRSFRNWGKKVGRGPGGGYGLVGGSLSEGENDKYRGPEGLSGVMLGSGGK